ncbi:MAG TPA: hypothetical protein VIT90_17070 [Lysobacter sp.]
MTAQAFDAPPDVPAFYLDDMHAMQAELWQHAQRVLGPCAHGYSLAPARFVADEASCATRIGNEITIYLDLNAAGDWACCAAILGHELVHALDGLSGHASWLEEGMGCLFGIGQCAAMFDDVPTHLCSGAYLHALKLVAAIPNPFDVVKSLRAQGLRMCSITPGQLMAAAPAVDRALAAHLCARFNSGVIGTGTLHRYDG